MKYTQRGEGRRKTEDRGKGKGENKGEVPGKGKRAWWMGGGISLKERKFGEKCGGCSYDIMVFVVFLHISVNPRIPVFACVLAHFISK